MLDQETARVTDVGPSVADAEVERLDDHRRSLDRVGRCCQRSDERETVESFALGEVAVPVLTLLGLEDRVEQVGARTRHRTALHCPVVRDRQWLIRRRVEQQEADRRVRRVREALQLLERGLLLTALPLGQSREARYEVFYLKVSTLTRPDEQDGIDFGAERHGSGFSHRARSAPRKPLIPLRRRRASGA